jgi:hypothetical protein
MESMSQEKNYIKIMTFVYSWVEVDDLSYTKFNLHSSIDGVGYRLQNFYKI